MNAFAVDKAREDENGKFSDTHKYVNIDHKSFKKLGPNDLFVAIFYLIKTKRRLILFNYA